MGVVGLETAFPVLYAHLVQKGVLRPGSSSFCTTTPAAASASIFRA